MLWTYFEIVSTITGILCVWLQTREKILAWPFGIVSVSLAAVIFFNSQLYSDFLLHIIFLILNIYGWYVWSVRSTEDDDAPILLMTWRQRAFIGPVIIAVSLLWGYLVDRSTNADLPYFDSFTTVGSLFAQYLLSRKVLENWLIWIVVDVVAINMYLYKGLYYFAFLFGVYLILCLSGWVKWRRKVN